MGGLKPAILFRLARNAVATDEIEDKIGRPTKQGDEAFTPFRPEAGDEVVRVGPRQGRDHLAVIAPRRAGADVVGLEHGDRSAGLGGMQRAGQSGEASADDRDIGPDLTVEPFRARRRRGRIGPQGAAIVRNGERGGIGRDRHRFSVRPRCG